MNTIDPPKRWYNLSPPTHALQYIRYGNWKYRPSDLLLPMDFPYKQEFDEGIFFEWITYHNSVFSIASSQFVHLFGKWEIK